MSSENMQPHDVVSSRPSRLGKASVVLGVIGLVMILIFPCGVFCIEVFEWRIDVEDPTSGYVFLVLFATGIPSFFVGPALGLVGSCLAVAGLLRKNRCRGVSIAGLTLNLATLLAFGFLLLWFMRMMQGVGAG